MNKTAIRNFAVWARNKLINDVTYRAGLMGVTANGIAEPLPQSTDTVQFFDIGMSEPYQISGEEIKQRKSLVEIIKRKEKDSDYATAFTSVVEEVAYTWFNRLIAIRFMEVNDYLPSHIRVLSSESGKLEPDLVTTPYDADLFFANGEEQIIQNLKDENRLDEVFRVLFIKQCNLLHDILPKLFENISDYTELLLNVSFIDHDSVVYHLVHDIPEDDFNVEVGGQVEIIGWLYQYYNVELKDETFDLIKKNIKVTKERVPSATQLFTPDWIVRYLVENSLGRLWIEGHNSETIRGECDYYVEEAKQIAEDNLIDDIKINYSDIAPEDIKLIDPCMGSGHILVYAFELLMKIYVAEGYSERDAAKSIVQNNIFGIDIDDRAAQLAYFAVMMKARQYNRRILTEGIPCNVISVYESNSFDRKCLKRLGELSSVGEKLVDAFWDAKEYGSILKIDITLQELDELSKKINEIWEQNEYGNLIERYETEHLVKEFSILIDQARIMTCRYHIVVTNPPYMGNTGMNDKLSSFVSRYFEDCKADMFAVFIEKCRSYTKKYGIYAMITQPSVVALSSFEKLRIRIIKEQQILSLLHMGRGIFGIDFGSAAFVIRNAENNCYSGKYFRLHQRTFQYIDPDDIKRIFLAANKNPEYTFDFASYKTDTIQISEEDEDSFIDEKSQKIFYLTRQDVFLDVPGNPFGYWVTGALIRAFQQGKKLGEMADCCTGMQTGNNEKYVRNWNEVCVANININNEPDKKWIKYNCGGDSRKWYGNHNKIVMWSNDGSEIRNEKSSVIRNEVHFFDKGISWKRISSKDFFLRYLPEGFIFDQAGDSMFMHDNRYLYFILGFCNSKIALTLFKLIAPTMNLTAGNMNKLPIIFDAELNTKIDSLVTANIEAEQHDWDSFETSWDFKKHPLI